MGEAQRLPGKSEVEVEEVDPGATDLRACLLAYADELAELFPEGFDRAELVSAEEVRSGGGACLVARAGRHPIGCAVLRRMDGHAGEIKHLWVDPGARNIGIARLLLAELEQAARSRAIELLRLDTHVVLEAAISLYRAAGYSETPPYGANRHAHLWFEKRLAPPAVRR